jgi:nucleotide-binding universal stress UspA family protein
MIDLFRHILVAIESTQTSLDAAKVATELAHEHGSALTFVHVVNEELARQLAHVLGRSEVEVHQELEANGRRYLREARRLAAAKGVAAEDVQHRGTPSVELMDEARARLATLLVIGKANDSTLHPHILGRVFQRILDAAEIPVLVVPDLSSYGPSDEPIS